MSNLVSVLLDEPGFSFSRFGPEFGLFLAKQIQSSSGFLKGLEWVQSSVLVDKPGFEVQHVKSKAVQSLLYLGSIQHLH